MRKLVGISGFMIMAVSALFMAAAVGDLVSGEDRRGVIFGLLIFFGLTTAAGFHLFRTRLWSAGKAASEDLARQREKDALQYAKQEGGRVTISGVAAHTDLTIDEAKAMLERFCVQGVAEVLFDEDGATYYQLKGLGQPEQKAKAQNPLAGVAAAQSEREG